MNGTVLPAWLHSIVFAVLSVYMFMLWAGLKRDSLSEAQKRLVERIEVLRSPGAALSGAACFWLSQSAMPFGLMGTGGDRSQRCDAHVWILDYANALASQLHK